MRASLALAVIATTAAFIRTGSTSDLSKATPDPPSRRSQPTTSRARASSTPADTMTGTDWLQTPDGRPGWAYFFVKRGYTVYMVDYPTRGRSAYVPDLD